LWGVVKSQGFALPGFVEGFVRVLYRSDRTVVFYRALSVLSNHGLNIPRFSYVTFARVEWGFIIDLFVLSKMSENI